MKTVLTLALALISVFTANAYKYTYNFSNTPISRAIVAISKDHPDINISFIYKELDNYRTSARVRTDNAYEALKQTVGLNPVSVTEQRGNYYVEAFQRGKYIYRGRVVGADKEPVAAATVMLLAPKDSAVVTYAMAVADGRFAIPCDRRNVIAKLSCMGYQTTYRRCPDFDLGTIVMPVQSVTLNQVKVEGRMADVYADRTVYIPSSRQKNASQNAVDLLRHMAIPQLAINPVDNSVKNNSGADVAIFFNFMPASSEDIAGLRMADVRRVEYLEFPTDPRFRGEQYVINIIVQEYEYGGYTKVSADEDFLTGLSSRVNVRTKFAYKKMVYDLYVASQNYDNHHTGYDVEGQYALKDDAGCDYTLTRRETVDDTRFRRNQFPVTFRATYNTDKVQIRNTVGYKHMAYPAQSQSGTLTLQPSAGADYTFDRSNPSRSNSFSYNGTFYFALPRDFSVNVTPQLSYTHNNNRLTYTTSLAEPIVRNARENATYYRLNAYLSKRFMDKHTLSLGFNTGNIINRLRYTGSAEYSDRFNNAFVYCQLCYRLQTKKFNLYTDVGGLWEQTNINSVKNDDFYPAVHTSLRFSPNTRHALSLYLQYANNTPGIDAKASDLLRDNEFMFISGNPHLDNARHVTCNFAYAWIPNNTLDVSAYANFFKIFDRAIVTYQPYDGGRALLRTYVNDGDYTQRQVGVSAGLKLFDNALQLYVSPKGNFNRSTGFFDKSYNSFSVYAQAMYYLKQFYFLACYQTPDKLMFSEFPYTYKSRNYYALEAGWGNTDWNVRVSAVNFFNRHWDISDQNIDTPLYKEHRTIFDTSYHARLNLSVTYTFGYGKKLQRGNEVGEPSGASSAILH